MGNKKNMKFSNYNAIILSTMLSCLFLSSNCIKGKSQKTVNKPEGVIIEEITTDAVYTINNKTQHKHNHVVKVHKLHFANSSQINSTIKHLENEHHENRTEEHEHKPHHEINKHI